MYRNFVAIDGVIKNQLDIGKHRLFSIIAQTLAESS
jgi:hypothetical protein